MTRGSSKYFVLGGAGGVTCDNVKATTNQGTTGVIAVNDFMTLASGKTLTAPTINASSTLQVGGVNINTIYAPLNSPNFTSTIQSGGSIVVASGYTSTSQQ